MKTLKLFLAAIIMFSLYACSENDIPTPAPDENISSNFDASFATALFKNGYIKDPSNITPEEIMEIEELYLNNQGITSLQGIEYFSSLIKLECNLNNITNIDLSKNSNLEYLSCYSNPLKSLNISLNSNLTTLDCAYTELNSMNLGHNTNLETFVCYHNNLTSLDLSKNR